jgi:predicted deacylase
MPEELKLLDTGIRKGESKVVNYDIARLPSGMMINMPVYFFRSIKSGPILLVLGGLHGDEVNGIEIVRRMIAEGTFSNLEQGTVIAIPVLNVFGFLNYSREVPDGKDVNRSFPGDSNGSLASRVARVFTKNIIPLIDYGVDFHTGGSSRTNYPQIRFASEDKNSELLAKAFAAPFTLNSNLIQKSLRAQASKMGKPIIVFEGGESMRFDDFAIHEGIEGAKRLMRYLGMINEPYTEKESIQLADSSWVRALRSGLFKPFIVSGETVMKGQEIGVINDPYGQYEVKVVSKFTGYVIGHNNNPVVHQGDALFHVGITN